MSNDEQTLMWGEKETDDATDIGDLPTLRYIAAAARPEPAPVTLRLGSSTTATAIPSSE